jgi:hypothetical protein
VNYKLDKGGALVNEILTQIANFGFPIVLSIYLLVRIEGKLNQLTESINELSRVIAGIK